MFELMALVGISLTVVGSMCSAVGKIPKIKKAKEEYKQAKLRKQLESGKAVYIELEDKKSHK